MVKSSKGYRARTRRLLKKPPRKSGMPPLGSILVDYQIDDKVDVVIDPSQQNGQPHRRFHGKVGEIYKKQGNAYLVRLNDGNKQKTLVVRPEHLRKHKL